MRHLLIAGAASLACAGPLAAEGRPAQDRPDHNRIDLIRPDAPELAATGDHPVGVRAATFTDADRIDVIATGAEGTPPTADRVLEAEIWYPAAQGTPPGGTYDTILRDGVTPAVLTGAAARDADPAQGSFPLVILSHGYPGNRHLMSHLGENLASKGYVVVAADHPDSTYADQGAFASTLVNRAVDQRFLLDSMAGLDDDLAAVTDADRAAVVGYSMGGYGALIFGGAGLSQTAIARTEPAGYVPPQDLLGRLAAGSDDHAALVDPRVKAVIAIAPWGRQADFWDAEGLAGLEKPLMLVAGSADDVSEYDAIRQVFDQTTGTTRHLLTYQNANHNAAAPIPAPLEAWAFSDSLGRAPFDHYADPVWDTVRMNNILQHFSTAFLDQHLKGEDRAEYLDLVPDGADGVWSMGEDDQPDAAHSYWAGFPNRSATGLQFETRQAGE
ncbi:alpha/beta fold hydrolase [Paracoccus liaowanqingii]|uniref:Alpha/beta fold hydrolase n=1 Tax=Paracoccus liaowanqingii TaxID=2560053 RepID=A0A4V1BJA4_9RHOB|nr:alpha/beta fold hydrolase [Paracoccus liaowanqingii]QBX35602.1 alpha/beta fold hydrolase [Paracoccus liaowanqingii]